MRPADLIGEIQTDQVSQVSRMSGRKQACFTCRQRKKKCDGKLPTCGLCARAGGICLYDGTSTGLQGLPGQSWMYQVSSPSLCGSEITNTIVPHTQGAPTPNSSTGRFSVDGSSVLSPPIFTESFPFAAGAPTLLPISSGAAYAPMSTNQNHLDPLSGLSFSLDGLQGPLTPLSDPASTSVPSYSAPDARATLAGDKSLAPSQHEFATLLSIFMDQYHVILPCLHQNRLHTRMASEYEAFESSPQFWVIAGCATWYQREGHSLQLSETFLHRASVLIDENIKTVKEPLITLQSLVYVIYQAYLSASMAEMWIYLGKACRLVSMLSWNRIDGRAALSPYAPKASSEEEKEERRRVVWALFLLDRAMSCLTGWSLALDDRQFMVNYPMPEARFQQGDFSSVTPEPFSMNLAKLVRPELARTELKNDPMGLIFHGYTLLGRILNCHNFLHEESYPNFITSEFFELEDTLTKFHLIADGATLEPLEQPLQNRCKSAWLSILIMTCTILLYHPTVDDASTDKARSDLGTASSFRYCVSATRKIMERIREEAIYSMETLINPLLLPSYFLVCRFLTITWHESKNMQDRNSIDTILMLIDRIGNRYGPLALKYRKSIMADVERDPDTMRRLRRGTGSYLGEECRS